MKSLLPFLTICLLTTTDFVAQINPLGLYVDIDGKVKFWEGEPNFNGNIDDTVYVTMNGETQLEDLRNLRYNYLTFVVSPRSNWTTPSNLDPSRVNDTTAFYYQNSVFNTNFPSVIFFTDTLAITTFKLPETKAARQQQLFFTDDIRGDGLNDSIVNLVKIKLNDLIQRFSGKLLPSEEMDQLRTEISYHDTVIDKIAVYDYLVDMMLTFEYDEDGLLKKGLAYHWNLGIEVDNLKYDKAGNLIYFSREELGLNTHEYFFKYDRLGRLKTVKENYRTPISENSTNDSYSKEIKLTYNAAGILNSKTEIQDGIKLTYFFNVK